MKKKAFVDSAIIIVPLLITLGGCRSVEPTFGSDPIVETYHNSRLSLDWAGVYTGLLPSAGGPGIDVQITLNFDGTYELRYFYLNVPGNVFIISGNFTWDDAGRIITLDTERFSPHFMVGEHFLLQLDLDANVIMGGLAGRYMLRKAL